MSTTPTNVPTWKEEFNGRIKAFSDAIGVEETKVREVLTELGVDGESDQSLTIIDNEEFLPMNDLFQAFVDSKLTQKAKLRAAMPHLRGQTHIADPQSDGLADVASSIKEMVDANRPLERMSDRELLDRYDEDSPDVWAVLKTRSHGRPFVIQNQDGSTNIPESLKILRIAKKQHTNNRHMVDGKPCRVFRAGEFLAKMLDESPVYRGKVLVDGYCADSDTNWADVLHETRVLARIYVEQVETAQLSKIAMKQICEDAKKGVEHFRENYGEAGLIYDELSETDSLPKLKVRPDSVKVPFSGKRDTGFTGPGSSGG